MQTWKNVRVTTVGVVSSVAKQWEASAVIAEVDTNWTVTARRVMVRLNRNTNVVNMSMVMYMWTEYYLF